MKNDVDELGRLLALGHDYGPNDAGMTPLMAAAHAGSLEPLRLLPAARCACGCCWRRGRRSGAGHLLAHRGRLINYQILVS